jgi:hypothetical protein
MHVGHHEEPRIRRQVERTLPEAVERLVHQRNQASTSFKRHTIITVAAMTMHPDRRDAASKQSSPALRAALAGVRHDGNDGQNG